MAAKLDWKFFEKIKKAIDINRIYMAKYKITVFP
jgi:hypothetical protein